MLVLIEMAKWVFKYALLQCNECIAYFVMPTLVQPPLDAGGYFYVLFILQVAVVTQKS